MNVFVSFLGQFEYTQFFKPLTMVQIIITITYSTINYYKHSNVKHGLLHFFILTGAKILWMLRSLMLRTNYVIRVMRIKDKGDKALNQISINR